MADVKTHDTIQDRAPNFREGDNLYIVRCFNCNPEHGRENYMPAVASGACAWCGWTDSAANTTPEDGGSEQ